WRHLRRSGSRSGGVQDAAPGLAGGAGSAARVAAAPPPADAAISVHNRAGTGGHRGARGSAGPPTGVRGRRVNALERLALERRVIVCAGPGGVGKTTTAAAIALHAARAGRRSCVVTI